MTIKNKAKRVLAICRYALNFIFGYFPRAYRRGFYLCFGYNFNGKGDFVAAERADEEVFAFACI